MNNSDAYLSEDVEGEEYNSEGEFISPDQNHLTWNDLSEALDDELSSENLTSPCPVPLSPQLRYHHILHNHLEDGYRCTPCSISFESLVDEQQHASERHTILQAVLQCACSFL
jgi:hypothetical protein